MNKQADQGRSKCQFVEGDQVFLFLQPYKKTSLKDKDCHKLVAKFYVYYTIFKQVGPISYQLVVPSHFNLHHFFHVSCLTKVIGTKC